MDQLYILEYTALCGNLKEEHHLMLLVHRHGLFLP